MSCQDELTVTASMALHLAEASPTLYHSICFSFVMTPLQYSLQCQCA